MGDYLKSGKVLDKPSLSSDEMYVWETNNVYNFCYKLNCIEAVRYIANTHMLGCTHAHIL